MKITEMSVISVLGYYPQCYIVDGRARAEVVELRLMANNTVTYKVVESMDFGIPIFRRKTIEAYNRIILLAYLAARDMSKAYPNLLTESSLSDLKDNMITFVVNAVLDKPTVLQRILNYRTGKIVMGITSRVIRERMSSSGNASGHFPCFIIPVRKDEVSEIIKAGTAKNAELKYIESFTSKVILLQ